MIDWPDNLVNDLARRKCVIILGSGISANSEDAAGNRPKTWEEFLLAGMGQVGNSIAQRDIKGLINERDYLTACELIKQELGKEDFVDLLMAEYHQPAFSPAEIHKHIHSLDSRIVATPNFDNIFDRYAQGVDGTTIVKRFWDTDIAQIIRTHKRVILKIHGSIEAANQIIFTRGEYAKARINNSAFYQLMDALAITHTFLFLGCGFNDPDIRLILEDYCYKYEHSKQHVFVTSNTTIRKSVFNVLSNTLNLKVLKYSPRDNHLELTQSLKELVPMVDNARVQLARNLQW